MGESLGLEYMRSLRAASVSSLLLSSALFPSQGSRARGVGLRHRIGRKLAFSSPCFSKVKLPFVTGVDNNDSSGNFFNKLCLWFWP